MSKAQSLFNKRQAALPFHSLCVHCTVDLDLDQDLDGVKDLNVKCKHMLYILAIVRYLDIFSGW